MEVLGTAPIHPVAFILAKLAAAVTVLFLLAPLGLDEQFGHAISRSPAAFRIAMLLLIAGSAISTLAFTTLGSATRVGLPEEHTELRTTGIYRVSRNPIYVGFTLVMLASCVLTPHWLNITCFLIAVLLHHRIVLGEERFLEARFGDAWRAYRAHVRRYL
jgi:protein-S-isoprenylcysteine O-methyltransferase Ste14